LLSNETTTPPPNQEVISKSRDPPIHRSWQLLRPGSGPAAGL